MRSAAAVFAVPALVCAGAASVRLIIVGCAFVFAVPALAACAGAGVFACAGVFTRAAVPAERAAGVLF